MHRARLPLGEGPEARAHSNTLRSRGRKRSNGSTPQVLGSRPTDSRKGNAAQERHTALRGGGSERQRGEAEKTTKIRGRW